MSSIWAGIATELCFLGGWEGKEDGDGENEGSESEDDDDDEEEEEEDAEGWFGCVYIDDDDDNGDGKKGISLVEKIVKPNVVSLFLVGLKMRTSSVGDRLIRSWAEIIYTSGDSLWCGYTCAYMVHILSRYIHQQLQNKIDRERERERERERVVQSLNNQICND